MGFFLNPASKQEKRQVLSCVLLSPLLNRGCMDTYHFIPRSKVPLRQPRVHPLLADRLQRRQRAALPHRFRRLKRRHLRRPRHGLKKVQHLEGGVFFDVRRRAVVAGVAQHVYPFLPRDHVDGGADVLADGGDEAPPVGEVGVDGVVGGDRGIGFVDTVDLGVGDSVDGRDLCRSGQFHDDVTEYIDWDPVHSVHGTQGRR